MALSSHDFQMMGLNKFIRGHLERDQFGSKKCDHALDSSQFNKCLCVIKHKKHTQKPDSVV